MSVIRLKKISIKRNNDLSLKLPWCSNPPYGIECRDPDLGGQLPADHHKHRKFLIVGGAGAGIGNFLIFFPTAYYYAALTGREILIENHSLLGEICTHLICGFPKYDDVAKALPGIFKSATSTRLKPVDMGQHLNGNRNVTETVVHADGFRIFSGWYLGRDYAETCINRITGCQPEDVSCHDRHALQRLIRGPLYPPTYDVDVPYESTFLGSIEHRMIGVPANLKHALLTLPHSYSPRFDAAVHLRCQFRHFEYLVGPEDATWPEYLKEISTFLTGKGIDQGINLFKVIEERIISEMPYILHQRRRLLKSRSSDMNTNTQRKLFNVSLPELTANLTQIDMKHESEAYDGSDERVYVYLASDNEVVKEAFAQYFLGHANISIMRIHNLGQIVHAKNIGYLKSAGNSTGLIDLLLDWYLLSLSDHIFAWRRDTDILSTFAHSAQRVSGNTELSVNGDNARIGHGIGSRGLQLYYKHGKPHWREY